jgi:hypothetical protein
MFGSSINRLTVDEVRSRTVNLTVLSGYRCEPSQLAGLCRIRMRPVEPRPPIFHHPQTLGHSAPLLRVCRAVPADNETILRFEKISSFIEHDQVMGIALESLLVGLLFAAGYVDLTLT